MTQKLSMQIKQRLQCPVCKSRLRAEEDRFQCQSTACGIVFPVVDGVPILLNEANSAFALNDFTGHKTTTFAKQPKVERFFSSIIPELGVNYRAKQNYARLAQLLSQLGTPARVLVVGSGETGRGMGDVSHSGHIELINTDVSLRDDVNLICDSHDLPFDDDSFDGVIVQAVLEHVADPPRCVTEIRRVLKPAGLVYAETPFMQQVHGGAFDFTRYTHLGHRRLFRGFEEISSGATAGAGTALAWAYQYFLLSFVRSRRARTAVKAVARLTSFWLRYFDRWLLDKPGTLDAALGYYFLGRKSAEVLSDRELIGLYRGAGAPLPSGS